MSEIYEGGKSLIKTAFRQAHLRIKAQFLSNRIKEDSESESSAVILKEEEERPMEVVSRSLEGRRAQFSMKKQQL